MIFDARRTAPLARFDNTMPFTDRTLSLTALIAQRDNAMEGIFWRIKPALDVVRRERRRDDITVAEVYEERGLVVVFARMGYGPHAKEVIVSVPADAFTYEDDPRFAQAVLDGTVVRDAYTDEEYQ